TPCSDYKATEGLIYFARMLDKIRLRAEGRLPDAYFTGVEDPTLTVRVERLRNRGTRRRGGNRHQARSVGLDLSPDYLVK
ncbi:MAG: DUF5069 domain-containing protein, partial [Verrucomicrobiota bacterium]|nr:DUF5069 domain-containing protein [Verrucomicrobiota bacterium]